MLMVNVWPFVIIAVLVAPATPSNKDTVLEKRVLGPNEYNSFSDNIQACLYSRDRWKEILTAPDLCNGGENITPLCYGRYIDGKALFAVCYNTATRIPEFTAHVIRHGANKGVETLLEYRDHYDGKWKTDQALLPEQVAAEQDYDPYIQGALFGHHNSQTQFCAKGHLTPNGDFDILKQGTDERSFTYTTTNIAPQWQPFNAGNWAALEQALVNYVKKFQRDLYVFTGTGGAATGLQGDIVLNGRVLAPKWYWKAVCDPIIKESIVFVAENSVGDVSNAKVVGCNGREQTETRGIVYCYGLHGAKMQPEYHDFKLPIFNDELCDTLNKGTFMDGLFKGLI